MENRAVTLIIRYKDSSGKWQRSPVPRLDNGRVKSGFAIIDGRPFKVKSALYFLRLYRNRKLIYLPAGRHAGDADALRLKQEQTSTVLAAAKEADIEIPQPVERKTIQGSAIAYILEKEAANFTEAAAQARIVTAEFLLVVKGKTYISEIKRVDIYAYHASLRKVGRKPRTVANKHRRLTSWLKFAGVDKGVKATDPDAIIPRVPEYDLAKPTIYNAEQRKALLAIPDAYIHICLVMGIKLGMRDQELIFAEFADIDWSEQVLRIRSKPKYGFRVKKGWERDISITDSILAELNSWQKGGDRCGFILAKKDGAPNKHLLRNLKRAAREAGLNCGKCDGCNHKHHECRHYTLHHMRRTFVTTLLRSKMDPFTVMRQVGHKDIQSTMRYAEPESGKELRTRSAKVKW